MSEQDKSAKAEGYDPKLTVVFSNERGTESCAIVVDAPDSKYRVIGVIQDEDRIKSPTVLETGKWVNHIFDYKVVQSLEGKLLTLIDLAISDKDQRDAFKGLVRRELYQTMDSRKQEVEQVNKYTCRDGGTMSSIKGYIQES